MDNVKQSLIDAGIIKIVCLHDPILEGQIDQWKYLTQKLIHHFSVPEVVDYVLQVGEGISDLQFKAGLPCFVYEQGLIKPVSEGKQTAYGHFENNKGITYDISKRISILKVAEEFGLKLHGDKAICPFHNDTDPSLTFNTERNTFKCWSSNCGKHGNLVDFIDECQQKGLERRKND